MGVVVMSTDCCGCVAVGSGGGLQCLQAIEVM